MVLSAYSGIGGGFSNTVSGSASNIGGGGCNTASGNYSSIINGFSGRVLACNSTILNGCYNTIITTASASSILAGTSVTAISANTAYATCLVLSNLPTSSAGLGAGTVWKCTSTNVLYIV